MNSLSAKAEVIDMAINAISFLVHYPFPNNVICKFGQSPPTGSVHRVLEILLLTVLIGW